MLHKQIAVACLALLLAASPAAAKVLQLAIGAPITTLDPHFYNTSPNNNAAFHVYDRLVHRAPSGRLEPGLALSWTPVSDTVWEFKLRPGVKWHDGAPFTAADVAFTVDRAKHVPNSLGGFENLVRPIISVESPDPLTLRMTTKEPTPNLPSDLTVVSIIAEHVAKSASTADFNAGKVAVGTGPYKFVSFSAGEKLVLVRNDDWWGEKQPWDQVTLSVVTNISARTVSLLSGGVDLIEAPAASDLQRLREDARITLAAVPGGRVAYVNPDFQPAAEAEPVLDKDGKPLPETPIRNLKVRRALSMAINRQAIVDRVLMGTGVATGQWLPPGSYSYAPDVKPPAFDPAKAKALLAEAGFPDGFRMTLSTANDRTPYAVEVAQAIAQMWSRIGVATSVDGMPFPVYSARASKRMFQAYFGTLGNPSMEAGGLLRSLLMTPAPDGAGTWNWSGYSNPALDALTRKALATVDDAAREKLLIQAIHMATEDVAFIPIYQFQNIWAMRKGLTYDPRADELTLAMGVHEARTQ